MKKHNVRDVAKLAEVSPATVSLVLNNRQGVSEETRQKVLKTLEETGYHLQSRKKTDSPNETGSIRLLIFKSKGLIIEGNEAFFSLLVEAIEASARTRNYQVNITVASREDNLADLISMINANQSDGMIILATEAEKEILEELLKLPMPIVVMDNYYDFLDADYILANNEMISYKAVRHLYDLGHRDIGYIYNGIKNTNQEKRWNAFEKTLSALGLQIKKEHVLRLGPAYEDAYRTMSELLKKGISLPTAYFAESDNIAIGMMRALKESGISVPEDVSIVGLDNIPFCDMAEPPLTSVEVNKSMMGYLSVKRLVEMIQSDSQCLRTEIGCEVVVRGSTAPPKGTQ